MGTTILVIACVAIVMFIVLAIYSADKKRKKPVGYEVTVPDGETHLVRRDGSIYWYGLRELSNRYLRYPDDQIIILQGDDNRFKVTIDNCFVLIVFASSAVKIKVKVEAFLRLNDVEKLFKRHAMATIELCVKAVANNACHEMKLKDLIKSGVSEVVAKDAILEKQSDFLSCGVELLDFKISDIQDAYGKEYVANLRCQLDGEKSPQDTAKSDKKTPHYPTLEEVVDQGLQEM
ncbi:MAG: hypothetical protein IKK52_02005 [Alphaproteobacteria bacterium]|nr:hypothetical protein [Alphaproteobacteria bacterium]